MKHQLLIILITVLSLNQIKAQDYDYGDVSKEELEEKFYPQDSSANAAILYKKETIRFTYTEDKGFVQEREVHERIKIYNNEGYKWANKKIYLYKGGSSNNERITGLNGVTFNLKNGEIEKTKLRKDGIFEEESNEYTEITSLTMPNINDGSVVEFEYKIISPFRQIDDLYFQSVIPINKLEISVSTPQFYYYNKQMNLKAVFYPEFEESKTNRSFSSTQILRDRVGNGLTKANYSTTKYYDNTFKISEEHIEGIKNESYAGNLDNYVAKMSLELSAILDIHGVTEKSLSTSWDKVSKTIYESSNFGGQLGKFSFYKNDLELLLADVEGDFEKAALVESLVKSKVKWNGIYGKYARNGIRSAYKEGKGNVADINLMLVSMLRSQGVNANPVLVSTRNNGVPFFPTREGFNYVICSVQKDDKFLLLDATEEYSTNNVLPTRVLNWQGRLIEEDGVSRWIDLKPNVKSLETNLLNIKINDDYTVSGKVSNYLTAYNAYYYRNKYALMTQEDQIKSLEQDKGDLKISELTIENAKEIAKPIKVNYEYELSDGIDEVGDKLYFSPLLFMAIKENPFKLDERKYPIDFVIPHSDKYMVNIMLPAGYKVESLPKSEALEFMDANIKFTYLISQSGMYLQLKVQVDILNPLILPKDYKDFKDFYEKIIEKQAEQIVLIKA
jgi:hypothetical protein